MKKVLALTLVLGALVLAGAWLDLLPGGWTLRRLAGRDEAAERYLARRNERLATFAGERAAPGAVVFLGSSTIERFPLVERFPGAPALNRGIGDELLEELDERLEASVPADAAAVVLYAGSVEFRERPPGNAAAIVRELGAFVARLRELRPQATVLVLGILPERAMPPERVTELRELNRQLAARARELGASFLTTDFAPLALPDGSLAELFSSDRLHLNADGYTELARAIGTPPSPLAGLLASPSSSPAATPQAPNPMPSTNESSRAGGLR
ncbi:MAG: GDSL-type esterase/lipase family protein [Planctomycetota bacterium]|nr:GDSL-type esterase/lipase family protein [Planctomycetota bacterium]